jgi:hypothetical protein
MGTNTKLRSLTWLLDKFTPFFFFVSGYQQFNSYQQRKKEAKKEISSSSRYIFLNVFFYFANLKAAKKIEYRPLRC